MRDLDARVHFIYYPIGVTSAQPLPMNGNVTLSVPALLREAREASSSSSIFCSSWAGPTRCYCWTARHRPARQPGLADWGHLCGGGGALIAAILGRHPEVRAVLFDLPQMVADARPFIEQAGFAASLCCTTGTTRTSSASSMSATRPCGQTLCCSSSSGCWHPRMKGPRGSSRTSIC
jgi:O-methyltransferase domain